MGVNIFRYPAPGSKTMIYSKVTARAFRKQCKNAYYVKLPGNKFVEVTTCLVSVYEKIDDWTSFEVACFNGNDADWFIFKIRKYINAKFRD